MKNLAFATVLGGVLGIFDGMTAWFTPEVRNQMVGIIIGSTIKGLIVGVLVGWYASRVHSLAKGMIVGLIVAAFFALLIAALPSPTARTTTGKSSCPDRSSGSSSAMPRKSSAPRKCGRFEPTARYFPWTRISLTDHDIFVYSSTSVSAIC
jgi:hypothetical protein